MSRDAFDLFEQPERGRFGDNETQPRPGRGPRVTGASDLVDLDMVQHCEMDRPSAVMASFDGMRSKAVWLPRSQIEILETAPSVRKLRGIIQQKVRITLPEWLAKEKGLI